MHTYKLIHGKIYKVAAALTGAAAELTVSVVNPVNGLTINGTARIDTGADITVISPNIASAIGATSTGTIQVVGVTGDATDEDSYQLDVDLGSSGYVSGDTVISDNDMSSLGVDVLIGIDVLSTGYFEYDGQTGTFSLQVGLPQAPVSGVPSWMIWAGIGLAVAGGIAAITFASWETKQVAGAYSKGLIAGEETRWVA